jgi:two-component system response regulator AtoC
MTRVEPASEHPVRDRVLVCDDEALIRQVVADALASEFEVEMVERAVDAIQRVMRTRYGALLLDLKLPGLGGLDAIPVVKRVDPDLPIIVTTGFASYETEQRVRATGIFYYLTKPFPVDELTAAVRAAVRSRHRRSGPRPPGVEADTSPAAVIRKPARGRPRPRR